MRRTRARIWRDPYYPLLLGGFILSAVLLPLWPVVRARYRHAEARRLEAEELRRG